ncbi:MAG: glycosyltransferase family 4 protein, partial [Solirubrobacterales bacterium]
RIGGISAIYSIDDSALDGPVRRDIEDMEIPVHIFGFPPADDLSSHRGRLEEMVSWSQGRDFDVALLNTATIFTVPGAELAQMLGIPYIWAIHESFHPSVLWSVLSPELRGRADAAIAGAEALVFEADATRLLFEANAGQARCLTLPYGLDFGPIDTWRATFDMRAERERAGIPVDAELVVCIGTIEPRKAQNTLAQAFDLIAEKHPRAHLAFVGGRKDPDCEALEKLIEARGANGRRMHVIPITPDVHSWYGMADLLVCASDVESLPRTVLEAMAWETPVLATNVFGLPELITDGETGWLCEPRDLEALAAGLDRTLSSSPEERAAVARAARALVETRHSPEKYGREIAELLEAAQSSRTS